MCSRPNYKFWPKIIMWEQRGRRETKRNSLGWISPGGADCLHTRSGLIMSLSDGGSHVRGTQDGFHRPHLFPCDSHLYLLCFCYFWNFLECVKILRQFKGKIKSFKNTIVGLFIQFLWENNSEPGNKGGACDTSPGVTHERVPSCPPLPRHGHGPGRW